MNTSSSYDYIICGAGCAGLSLAMHIANAPMLREKRILIIDQESKNKNDRTWCFWEKGEGLFQSIVYKEWKQLLFHSETFSKSLDIQPYSYKLIRGIDFYNYCLDHLKTLDNITFLQAPVEKVFSENSSTGIKVNGDIIKAQFIFNSILLEKPQLSSKHCWLLQHFKGWFIESYHPVFDDRVGTLMDFRTSQDEGTTFFYVLPFSPTRALVEYTLFSHQLLKEESYEKALQQYIEDQLNITSYKIIEKEFGIIPMTNYRFTTHENNLINIGTAGGQTKGSSGYTFQYIQKHSAAITASLVKHNTPFHIKKDSSRFHFYDSVLLHILNKRSLRGSDIFTDLFKKNKAKEVFAFLDNESSLVDEIKIISTLPTLPFTKAAIKQIAS